MSISHDQKSILLSLLFHSIFTKNISRIKRLISDDRIDMNSYMNIKGVEITPLMAMCSYGDIDKNDDEDEENSGNWEFEDDPSDERNVQDYFAYGNMVAMFKDRVDAELNNSKSPFRIALEKFVSNNGPWPRSLHDAIESFLLVLQKHEKFDLNDPDYQGMTSRGHLQRWWDDSIENYYQTLGTPGAIARAKGVFNTLFLIWCKKLDTEMKVKDTLHSDNPGVNIDI